MKDFVVSYDLHDGDDYEPLYKLLSENGGEKVLESVWLLKRDDNCSYVQIIRELRQVVAADRKVFVAEIAQRDGIPILMEDPREKIQ